MKTDLHIHTIYSDGGTALQDLFDKLHKNNVKIISITDHCVLDAYSELKYINTYSIKIINGIEMDVKYRDNTLHLLLYNFDVNSVLLTKYLNTVRVHDINYFEQSLFELNKTYNIKYTNEQLKYFEDRNNYFDKVRINNFLVELGVCSTPKEAFDLYTKNIKDKKRLVIDIDEFIAIANDSNALSFIAHPVKYLKYYESLENLCKVILELKEFGLNGVEVYNNRQTESDENYLLKFCKNNNLLISGGSDYHNKIGSIENKELGKVLGKDIDSINLFISKEKKRS